MGVGLTRPGAGPNGETVVADSEQALDLFFFKHGIAQVGAAAGTGRAEGRVARRQDPLHPRQELLHGAVQPRPAAVHLADARRLRAAGGHREAGDSKGSFRIRRAKTKFEGWMYKPELEFEVQLNWPDANGSPVARFMEDANIDWDISKKKTFRVRFGQFKAPYGRQQLTSSGAQQFVDRADTDARYNPGRETGIALWGTLGGNKLDWRVMASNGNGRSQDANDNSKYLYTGAGDVAGRRQRPA